MLGPRPRAKKVFQLLPPGFLCFSALSLFLLEFGIERIGSLRNRGLQANPPLTSIPFQYLSTGEAGVLGVVGSVGVPRRPCVLAWASSSVSRRVEGLLPARDLGLGRRQRPGEVEKGTAISFGQFTTTGKAKRHSPSPGPQRAHPGWQGRGRCRSGGS